MNVGDYLRGLRGNEPVRMILWPALIALIGWLVARGTIDTDAADLITAVALLILGPVGIEVARAQVTPGAHVTTAVEATVDQVRDQVGERFGQPGLDVLAQVQEVLQAAAESRGRHAE